MATTIETKLGTCSYHRGSSSQVLMRRRREKARVQSRGGINLDHLNSTGFCCRILLFISKAVVTSTITWGSPTAPSITWLRMESSLHLEVRKKIVMHTHFMSVKLKKYQFVLSSEESKQNSMLAKTIKLMHFIAQLMFGWSYRRYNSNINYATNHRSSVELDQRWRLGMQRGGRNVTINSTTRCGRPTLLLLLLPGSVWFRQNPSNRAWTLSDLRVCSQR